MRPFFLLCRFFSLYTFRALPTSRSPISILLHVFTIRNMAMQRVFASGDSIFRPLSPQRHGPYQYSLVCPMNLLDIEHNCFRESAVATSSPLPLRESAVATSSPLPLRESAVATSSPLPLRERVRVRGGLSPGFSPLPGSQRSLERYALPHLPGTLRG